MALLVNDLEDAYVAYMKGSTIMIEIVRLHSDYLKIKTDPLYAQLRKVSVYTTDGQDNKHVLENG